jgi:hypothetical protein
MKTRHRLLVGALLFVLGAASSQGAGEIIHAIQNGDDLKTTQIRALEVAAQVDDSRLMSLSNVAQTAMSGGDHLALQAVALQGKSYTATVTSMRAALSFAGAGPEPEWFYTCYLSAETLAHRAGYVFDNASSLPLWTDAQTTVVEQTAQDLDMASQYLDLVTTGGTQVAPKSTIRPGPNGAYTSEGICVQIDRLSDTANQRQWPG